MTPQDIITQVRRLTNDSGTNQRNSDAVLVGFVNQAVKRMVALRPDLFVVTEAVATTASQVGQTLPTNAVRLLEIYSVANGSAIQEVNRETMDQMYPEWTTEAAGTPVNWMRHPRHPTKYFLYPRPSASISLNVEYIKAPSDYTTSQDMTEIPDAYFGALIDCVVFLVESVNDEHTNDGRAKMFFDSFVAQLQVDKANRAMVDGEGGQVGESSQ